MSFCQSDPPMIESFWQKNRLVTFILSPVANFGYQSLEFSQLVKKHSIITRVKGMNEIIMPDFLIQYMKTSI